MQTSAHLCTLSLGPPDLQPKPPFQSVGAPRASYPGLRGKPSADLRFAGRGLASALALPLGLPLALLPRLPLEEVPTVHRGYKPSTFFVLYFIDHSNKNKRENGPLST